MIIIRLILSLSTTNNTDSKVPSPQAKLEKDILENSLSDDYYMASPTTGELSLQKAIYTLRIAAESE